MTEKLKEYYGGDEFAAGIWKDKYAVGLMQSAILKPEETPYDMHMRLAVELAMSETKYISSNKEGAKKLSDFGKLLYLNNWDGLHNLTCWIFNYLDRYKYIIPQGSIMSMLGNYTKIGSISNCFVIPGPLDSYGGIFKTDQEIAQLQKRRAGVGTHLNNLRPDGTPVTNAAGTSTGAHSFMGRYSNTTREVAQNGRRGALMLLMSCLHPDIFKFVTKKSDLTQVTGANVSVMLTDEFMRAALANEDFVCRFPIDHDLIGKYSWPEVGKIDLAINGELDLEYNKITTFPSRDGENFQLMKIHAKELLDLITEMAWKNGEPGIAFIDTIINYSPEGVYDEYRPVASNPCGEQWMQAYDSCRLMCLNLFGIVVNPYTNNAYIDYEKLYEIAYIQQRLADDIVDLEVKHVDKIMNKISQDQEPSDLKAPELEMWRKISKVAQASRRTGCGFTGMADMLAAIGLKYDSNEAIDVIKKIAKKKMEAELDCTIDLAIQRGPFKGWDHHKEFLNDELGYPTSIKASNLHGNNAFYRMLRDEFPDQCVRMYKYGRRNVSWSTVAPTGTVSIVAILNKYPNMTAGIEPMFSALGFRNVKVVPGTDSRVDFVDANGDSWRTSPIIMGGLREWIDINNNRARYIGAENLPIEVLKKLYKESPYYGSEANDISWEKRVEIQSIVQKYTTNAISSTLNLPNDVKQEVVKGIYEKAWRAGLKGVTVYRDGCRTGVLTTSIKKDTFDYSNSTKRPKSLVADLHVVTVKGERYNVAIGLMDGKPYEVFAWSSTNTKACTGEILKIKKGHYDFKCEDFNITGLEQQGMKSDEAVLTRLISGMLRHGAKPQYVMEQIDKCDLEVVSYGKAVSRILKKYVTDEEMVSRNVCSSCGSTNIRMQEGCLTCIECGSSKCG